MPTIPSSNTYTPNIQGARYSPMDTRSPAGGQLQQLGQDMNQAGAIFARIAEQAAREANDLRVNDAMNKVVAARLHYTHDKTDGFINRLGETAIQPDAQGRSLEDVYNEKFGNEITSIAAGLGNDAQRTAFGANVGQVVNQFHSNLQTHLSQEGQRYEMGVRKSTITLAQNAALKEWDQPDKIAASRNAITQAIASDKSLSPEQRAIETINQLSPMHGAVVATAMEKNKLDFAAQYLQVFDAEMAPDTKMRLQKALDVGTTRVRVQAFGDSIMESKLPMEDALKLAREGFTGEERDQAVKELHNRYQEADIAQTNKAKDLGKQAWSSVMSTGRLSNLQIAALTDTAPEELRQIRDWQDQKRRQAKAEAEGGSAAKEGAYYGLRRLAMDDAQKFANLDLSKSEPYLSKGDYRHLIEVQASIGKADAKAMESQRTIRNTLGTIRAEVTAIGIDLTPKEGTPAARETALFMDALTRSLDDATKAKGAALTPEEGKRVGMGLLREGVEQGSGLFGMFTTKKRGYQIATDPSIKPDASFVAKRFNDIPTGAREALVNDYRAKYSLGAGAMTDGQKAEIERAYTRGVQLGRF